ncbi:ABC transporter permease [Paenibacillus thermotolerans]|uniref:ABC transporter permease n=1 Tax=Paenibacillus thermotolerans TaxID=3027807 RepID=UPI00236742B6|nr:MULTISPECIES: ABC-2 family transporter protein [unclassified Paenibacillus]
MIKKKYVSIAKNTMQHTLAYRSTYFISLLGSFIFIFSMLYLWKAIFSGREQLSGFTWEQMKVYLLITFLTNSLISWYSETKISRKIVSGDVVMDLLKPVDFQKARIAETVGSSLLEGGIAAVMIAVILFFTQGFMLPPSAGSGILFLISLGASLLIKFGIIYLASLTCFWSSNGIGIAWTRAALTNFFSGALVPIPFFPNWLQTIAYGLPFQGIVHIPASIYLGKVTEAQLLQSLALQLFWVIALWTLGIPMWKWAVRQVTIHGG